MKISASDGWKLLAILRKCVLHVNKNTENSAKSYIWSNFYRCHLRFWSPPECLIGNDFSTRASA
ncbi:hypothetical protein DIE22_14885 [Burkholderia sp. Bp9142]|nr:hypothetical protein DIE22_14885 [Burkholderia sp. Bp9142]RQR49079.1 hypothetical protein DIE21_21225 [Burkholderia sp. Bp9140]